MVGFAHGGTIVMLFQETNGNPCLYIKSHDGETFTHGEDWEVIGEYMRLKGELLR